MCGFVVWIDEHGRVAGDHLVRMRDTLTHRGPDDAGSYISSDNKVGFGFRRLSIIDLSSSGHQPMSDSGQKVWIAFNGEIYNFVELRRELTARGHGFRSKTDTEVLLAAYLEWGPSCVERFIGMFAFAIWDLRTQTLFAARDRLGIKPLYYTQTADTLLLGSELKALAAAPGLDLAVDHEALRGFLARGYVSSPDSIFRSVRSLPPGCTITWSRETRQAHVHRYWQPDTHYGTRGNVREDELIDELDALLRSSIRYRLISDVPLGAFLSGGIDSTLVVAMMREVSNAEVKTFTIGFRERQYDETEHAAAIARHLGTTHTTLTATHRDVLELLEHLPAIYDEPFADSSQIPTCLVSRLTKNHVTVALSGDGGDELFCGYANYQRMHHLQHVWKLPQRVRDWLMVVGERLPFKRLELGLRGLATATPAAFADYLASNWRPNEIDELAPVLRSVTTPAMLPPRPGAPVLDQLMLIDMQRYLPNDILTKLDRASMAVGLEARVPLLDHRIVEFALRLPLRYKFHRGTTKYLLRRVLERYVPRDLVDRPKQGFGVPLDGWLRQGLKPLIERYLNPADLRMEGLFSPSAVSAQVDRFLAGRCGHLRIWALLMFRMWRQRYPHV